MKLRIYIGDLDSYEVKKIRELVKEISLGLLGIQVSIRKSGHVLIVKGFYYESETETLIAVLKVVYELLNVQFDCEYELEDD